MSIVVVGKRINNNKKLPRNIMGKNIQKGTKIS